MSSARKPRGSWEYVSFVEKEEGKLGLRRAFKIVPSDKILMVEDVVTKGRRVKETIDIVRAHRGQVTGLR